MTLSPTVLAAVAAGGAFGAVGRYVIGQAVLRIMGSGFPWGTVTVNVVGSFLMGVMIHGLTVKLGASKEVSAFMTVGVLGGFTTFSTFSLDAVVLMERGQVAAAAGYVLGSVIAGILALFAGLFIARWIWS